MRPSFKHLEPGFLFEYEKGGGSGMMMAMMMQMQQQQRAAEADRLYQEAQRKEDQKIADAKAANELKQLTSKNTGRINKSFNNVLSQARQDLISQGYQGQALEDMMSNFENEMRTTKESLDPATVQNVNEHFSTKPLESIVSKANTGYQSGLNTELDKIFSSGFEKNLVPTTMDDAVINKFIEEQFGTAKTDLDRMLARGSINDVGFATGLTELGNQKTKAVADANKLGEGVLSGYWDELGNFKEDQYGLAGKAKVGSNFDLGGVKTGLEGLTSGFGSKLDQDIMNAIGGNNFFNTATILGKAGTGSGMMNPAGGVTNPTGGLGAPIDTRTLTLDDDEKRRRTGTF